MTSFIIAILSSSVVTVIITTIVSRSKTAEEVKQLKMQTESTMIDNIKKYSEVVEIFVAPLKKEIEELKVAVDSNKKENMRLKIYFCSIIECENRKKDLTS